MPRIDVEWGALVDRLARRLARLRKLAACSGAPGKRQTPVSCRLRRSCCRRPVPQHGGMRTASCKLRHAAVHTLKR